MCDELLKQIDLYPAMIFDMDGTIMNSELKHHESWNHALQEFGFPKLSTEELYSLGGLPSLVIAQRCIDKYGIKTDPVAIADRKNKLYIEHYMIEAQPFPMVANLVKELSAKGKRVAIATSSHKKEAEFLLGKHGLLEYIHALVTGDMVTHGKPNPDIYLLAAQGLNSKAEDCLVFEDTVVGMAGVKNAQMDAVKVFEGHFDCDHVIKKDEFWAGREQEV